MGLEIVTLLRYFVSMVVPNPHTLKPMKYKILGVDNMTTDEKLEKFTGVVPWSYLKPHFINGVLFFVDPSLTLAEVGRAFSNNEEGRVKALLKCGDLLKIGDLHAAQWEKGGVEFETLVVSPFVLCQPIG